MLFNNNVFEDTVQEAAVTGIDFETTGNDMLMECATAQCEISTIVNVAEAKAMEAYIDAVGNEAVIESTLTYVKEEAENGIWQKVKNFFQRIIASLKNFWTKVVNWVVVKLKSHEQFLKDLTDEQKKKSGKVKIARGIQQVSAKITQISGEVVKNAVNAIDSDRKAEATQDKANKAVELLQTLIPGVKAEGADTKNAGDVVRNYLLGMSRIEMSYTVGELATIMQNLIATGKGINKVGMMFRNAVDKIANLFKGDAEKTKAQKAMTVTNFIVTVNNTAVSCYKEALIECRSAINQILKGKAGAADAPKAAEPAKNEGTNALATTTPNAPATTESWFDF